ncbi:hypothetical protein AZA_51340 [Nitrospirillum viridazoti Y2]|nr:hypothetical protein AZA_51340 [Nitrospirillum amazonense Y2]
MSLHIAPLPTGVVFQFPTNGIEGIPHGHHDVFMSMPLGRMLVGNNVPSRHRHGDADLMKLALMVPPAAEFDDDPATQDRVEEAEEFLRLVPDVRFQGGGGVHVVENDLQRKFHLLLPSRV